MIKDNKNILAVVNKKFLKEVDIMDFRRTIFGRTFVRVVYEEILAGEKVRIVEWVKSKDVYGLSENI